MARFKWLVSGNVPRDFMVDNPGGKWPGTNFGPAARTVKAKRNKKRDRVTPRKRVAFILGSIASPRLTSPNGGLASNV